ncbi:MAG TPA: polysaccharide pyruvyl transferase family protein [Leptolyngbyaceae cyanobacterium M33_DOE_097]|uniref:Polysaccharide pyruvyl transferase family protein n=1 Tax=Oscillatoriales cyanobacterium SpSt-418 TaxID=2282169 RepID=A0A7C3KHZ9_9CYAN|nr:polysaccharide pyruvyl transferase family protein [Leptolyngbyaceae cyanobacterium M33_DOE_097]
MKVLVVGWFSYENCNVTAGDLMAKDVACNWLELINCDYDVAFAPPFCGGVNWRLVEPSAYSHVVFVCGPFPYKDITIEFLNHFRSCQLIGLDLSMIEPVNYWNPFDSLLERDSSAKARPDISFLSQQSHAPVVGVILVHPQHEYKDKCRHEIVNEAIQRLIDSNSMVVVPIDTCLDPNKTNLRNAVEVETLIARMDLVITTRLHGTVLAIKNEVPPLVIDPIEGGAKVSRQAQTIGWKTVLTTDDLSDENLQKAFDYCKTKMAKEETIKCKIRAIELLEEVRSEFISCLTNPSISTSRIDLPYELSNHNQPKTTNLFRSKIKTLIYPIGKVGKRSLHKIGRQLMKF